mmetsp:Transcript_92728/g.271468  ORF Transcript_92728/g.271468 Transcript_92728/m.271468 type:complete len:712 (+) Transcript_92728:16-2151(+)
MLALLAGCRRANLQHHPAGPSRRNGGAGLHTREVVLGLLQASDLGLPLLAACVEVGADPRAVVVQGLLQLPLGGEVAVLLAPELLRVEHLALQLRQSLLRCRLGLRLRVQHLLRGCSRLVVVGLSSSIPFTGFLDLLLQVLLDHPQNCQDALRLALPASVVGPLPAGLGGLVGVLGVGGLALQGQEANGNLVPLVEAPQRQDRLREQLHGLHVVPQRLRQGRLVVVPHLKLLGHLLLRLVDVPLERADVALQLPLLVAHATKRAVGLLYVALEVCHVVAVLLLAPLAPVSVRDVVLLLLPQQRDHLVDGRDDLVKVAARRDLRRQRRETAAVVLSGQPLQMRRGGHRAAAAAGGDLQEARGGVDKRGLGLRAREDLYRPPDPRQLLGAQARALAPLQGLALAAGLRLPEEGLVGLELRLGVVRELHGLGQLLRLVGLVQSLLVQGQLKGLHLRALCGHEVLEGLLRLRLLGVGLLHVHDEGVVHALEDALDLRGLRRIVAKGIVGNLSSTQCAGTRAHEVFRPVHEAPDQSEVLVANRTGNGRPGEDAAHARHDAEELGLLQCLQEASPASACAREDVDCRLQGSDTLLGLGFLLVVAGFLLRSHLGGLALRLQVCLDVFFELLDLCAVRAELAFQPHDARLQALDLILGGSDLAGLGGEAVLAPAGVGVVGPLLRRAVGLNPRLQVVEQAHDARDGRRSADGPHCPCGAG